MDEVDEVDPTIPIWGGPPPCIPPHCLYCNWDGSEDWLEPSPGQSTFAAFQGEREAVEEPADWWPDRRNYVAWLCTNCSEDEITGAWFDRVVRERYPQVTFVRDPMLRSEYLLDSNYPLHSAVRHGPQKRHLFKWWWQ